MSQSACARSSSLCIRNVIHPESGTQRCSSPSPAANRASRTARGKGRSTTPPRCTRPTSALPMRNSRPPKRCECTETFGQTHTSSSSFLRFFIINFPASSTFDAETRSLDSMTKPPATEPTRRASKAEEKPTCLWFGSSYGQVVLRNIEKRSEMAFIAP